MVVRVVPKQPYHLVTILVVPPLFPTAPLPPQGDRRRLRALQERAKEAKPTKANEEKRPQKTSAKRRETRNTAKAAADKEASGRSSPKPSSKQSFMSFLSRRQSRVLGGDHSCRR